MRRLKKTKIILKDLDSLRELLQEAYNDASDIQHDVQRALTDLITGVNPQDVDDYARIAKERSNLLKVKESATRIKVEIGRIQHELLKKNLENSESGAVNKGASEDDFKYIKQIFKEKGINF